MAVLASAIKVIKTVCQHYFSDMLQCLVLLEYELRLSLRSGLNFIDAFGGAIGAIESICYTDCLGMYKVSFSTIFDTYIAIYIIDTYIIQTQ